MVSSHRLSASKLFILVWEDSCPKLAKGGNCCPTARISYWDIENVPSSQAENLQLNGLLLVKLFDSKTLQNMVHVLRGEPEHGDQWHQCLVYEVLKQRSKHPTSWLSKLRRLCSRLAANIEVLGRHPVSPVSSSAWATVEPEQRQPHVQPCSPAPAHAAAGPHVGHTDENQRVDGKRQLPKAKVSGVRAEACCWIPTSNW